LDLGKPPVIEVGIELQFDPRPDRPPWELRVAGPFVERFQASFPHVEVLQAAEMQIETRSPAGYAEKLLGKVSLDRLRARNGEGTRWIQVGNDLLAYSLVRGEQSYPGFDAVRTEALAVLDAYVDYFQPTSVRRAAVTYLDQFDFPVPAGSNVLRVEDYLLLRAEVPDEPFGPVGSFSLQFFFPGAPPARVPIQLQLHSAPTAPGSGIIRFQMRSHCLCDNVCSLDKEEISRRLEVARLRLRECFRASFTDKGWALFQPREGG
jgi:uncharacterized protein (TIGR04255 family)